MIARVVTDEAELTELAPAWDALADAAGAAAAAHAFWCLPWWRHLGRGRPTVAIVEDAGDLIALAPLHERRLAGLPVSRFLGHGLGAVSELLVAPGRESSAARAWDAVLRCGGRLELLEYRADAEAGLGALLAGPWATRVAARNRCPFIALEGSLDAYLSGRRKKLRQTLRRAGERLAEEGLDHSLEVVTDAARLDAVLPQVQALHDRAEEAAPRGRALAGRLAPFTREALAAAAGLGRLRLFVGRLGDRPVSFDVAFATGGSLELWLGRFDPEFRRFAPGHLALREIVRCGFEEGFRRVDLGLGDDQYKRMWCDHGYDTLEVAAARTPRGLALTRAALGVRGAAGQIRRIR